MLQSFKTLSLYIWGTIFLLVLFFGSLTTIAYCEEQEKIALGTSFQMLQTSSNLLDTLASREFLKADQYFVQERIYSGAINTKGWDGIVCTTGRFIGPVGYELLVSGKHEVTGVVMHCLFQKPPVSFFKLANMRFISSGAHVTNNIRTFDIKFAKQASPSDPLLIDSMALRN